MKKKNDFFGIFLFSIPNNNNGPSSGLIFLFLGFWPGLPSHAIFFEASRWPSDHMIRSRPLIGPQVT